MNSPFLQSERLYTRPFRATDVDDLHRLRSNSHVMRFFPGTQNRKQVAESLARAIQATTKNGFHFMPVFQKSDNAFCGFAGLAVAPEAMPCHPDIEIGWSLLPDYWGKGYASEIAREWMDYGFKTRNLDRIVSFAVINNAPSIAVMKRLAMRHAPQKDFDHPNIPEEYADLKRHVFYEITRQQWENSRA